MRALFTAALTLALGCAGLAPGPAQAQSPHTHQHSFSGAEHWAEVFDDPGRDAWQKPHQVPMSLRSNPMPRSRTQIGHGLLRCALAHFSLWAGCTR
jgi:hypothetical protein